MGEAGQGLKAAVDLTAGAAAAPEPQATQLPLYPAEQLGEVTETTAIARQAALRGPGRPPGRMNKKTEEWAQLILGKYRSPLVFLAEVYSRRVGDLALELGCKPVEALEIQRRAASELAPYLHGKMPVQVEIRGNLPMLVLGDPAKILEGFAAEIEQGALPDLSQLQPIENQGLSEGEDSGLARGDLPADENTQSDQAHGEGEPLIADQPAGQLEEQK